MNKSSVLHSLCVAVLLVLSAAIALVLTDISHSTQIPAAAESLTELSVTETEAETTQQTTVPIPTVEIVYDEYETDIEQENFNKAVIIGNSQAQALSNYGLIKEADFITRIGLSVNKVLTASEGEPLINELYGTDYDKVILVFGENELGWPYPKNFISEYKKVINEIREILPDATIYCHAVFPVTKSHSEKDTIGVNNENVALFNELIKEMCEEEGYEFIMYSDTFSEDHGALPESVANDGVHFNYDYCKIWASELSKVLSEE